MDLKAFALGALTGCAACGLAWWLMDRADGVHLSPHVTADHEPSPGDPGLRANVSQDVPPVGAHPNEAAAQVASELIRDDISRESAKSADSPKGPATKAPGETGEIAEAGIDTSNVSRTARLKETKDLSWSHNMEQALRQYLAGHKSASMFDIKSIDCRTTFCELEAVGFDERAWPEWDHIVWDIKQQPWSDCGSTGSSGSEHEGRPVFVTTLWRAQQNSQKRAQ